MSRLGDLYHNVTNGNREATAEADAETDDAPEAAGADLRGKLLDAFVSYMRDRLGNEQASEEEVLSRIAEGPGLDDGALSRRLAEAVDFYGGKEGETNVSPAQKEYLKVQLLLALTKGIDWRAELDAQPASPQEVSSDGTVLHGTEDMTIAEAAGEFKKKIGKRLEARFGEGANEVADALAPVLIGDPTLFLSEPSDTILYGSPEWAQLWIGIEYAEGTGRDPAQLSTDELLALGRTAISPAKDGGTAADDAAAYRTTKFLVLIARARGKLDGQEITEENREEVERILEEVAEEVFADDFAFGEAIDDITQEMPTRRELAATILREHGLDPDQKMQYPVFSGLGPAMEESTLAEYYFEHGSLPSHDDLPDPSTVFEERFATYKSEYSEGMATILGRFLDSYAQRNNLDLSAATIKFLRPEAHASNFNGRFSESVVEKSDRVLIVEVAVPGSGFRYCFLSLEDIGKGLQDIPADTPIDGWIFNNSNTIYTAEQINEYTNFLNTPALGDPENRVVKNELFSGVGTEIGDRIREYYAAQIAQYHDHARGETRGEAIGNFFLDLIPFRSMIVAIQKGDVGGAILNGLFDILSFIPFLGEGIKALQVGAKAIGAGLSTMVRTTLRQGLTKGLSVGLRVTGSFGREFGGQFLKVTATGLENALPIPTPAFASHVAGAGTKKTARAIDSFGAADSELASLLEQTSKHSEFVEVADDGRQVLAPGTKVMKDADGIEWIELDEFRSLSRDNGVDVEDVTLAVGHTDDEELLFFKKHESVDGSFYTRADPRTGESYGLRMTLDQSGWLVANCTKIARLANAVREAVASQGADEDAVTAGDHQTQREGALPKDLIASGISRLAGGTASSNEPVTSAPAQGPRKRRMGHDLATAALETTLDAVPSSRIEVSYSTDGQPNGAENGLPEAWAKKVKHDYEEFDDSVLEAVMKHIRREGGLKITLWTRKGRSGDYDVSNIKYRMPRDGEKFGNYIDRVAEFIGKKVKIIKINLLLYSPMRLADKSITYLAIGGDLPLPTQIERSLVPEGHAIKVVHDLGASPLIIEHNKTWGGTDDAEDYGTIGKHAEELASKILQRFSFNDGGLEKEVLHAIRKTGGIKFQGWLSDLDGANDDYSFEEVVDPILGDDDTLKGYVGRAAHLFAEAFERDIRPQEYGDIDIEHIRMVAELADIRLKDDEGTRSMRATFAAITKELKATDGDVEKSDTFAEAVRSSLTGRGVVLDGLPREKVQALLEDESKKLLKAYFNYAAENIEFQQDLLLLRRPHPAEYAAEQLGAWLGIKKEQRYKLVEDKQEWIHTTHQKAASPYEVAPYLITKQKKYTTSLFELFEDDNMRKLFYEENKNIEDTILYKKFLNFVERGKENQFKENFHKLFSEDMLGLINNDVLGKGLENIKDSYIDHYDQYVSISVPTFRQLEAEKMILRSENFSLISQARSSNLEDLVAQLGEEQVRQLDSAVANFKKLLENRRDEDQLHNLEHLKEKRLALLRSVVSKFPLIGDVIDIGIDAARGDLENMGHDMLRVAAWAANALPGPGPILSSVLFAADAAWGEGESIVSYLKAKQRGDEAGADAAAEGMALNGVGFLMSGIPFLPKLPWRGAQGAVALERLEEGAQESVELQEVGAGSKAERVPSGPGNDIRSNSDLENLKSGRARSSEKLNRGELDTVLPEPLRIGTEIPEFYGVTPKMVKFTSHIQNAYIRSEEFKIFRKGGICAAYVSIWIEKKFRKIKFMDKKAREWTEGTEKQEIELMKELQVEYEHIYLNSEIEGKTDIEEAHTADRSLMVRRRLHIEREFHEAGANGFSKILQYVKQGRGYASMGIGGKKGPAHAIGLAFGGDKPQFFDPNWGIFEFKNAQELEIWVTSYLGEYYKNIERVDGYAVRDALEKKLPAPQERRSW